MLMLQQLGSEPKQWRGWKTETAGYLRTGRRCSHALLHTIGHLNGSAALPGAGRCGVPLPGNAAGGGQARATAECTAGLPVELHLCRPGQPAEFHRGTTWLYIQLPHMSLCYVVSPNTVYLFFILLLLIIFTSLTSCYDEEVLNLFLRLWSCALDPLPTIFFPVDGS